jgi:hypothetical protein
MGSSSFNADDIYFFEEFMSREDRMIMDVQTKLEPRALIGNQDENLFYSTLQLY